MASSAKTLSTLEVLESSLEVSGYVAGSLPPGSPFGVQIETIRRAVVKMKRDIIEQQEAQARALAAKRAARVRKQ